MHALHEHTRQEKHDPYLSVLVPCYNEERNLRGGVLNELIAYLQTQSFNWEILVVDDGSTDQSMEILKRSLKGLKAMRILACRHGGKFHAVMEGVKSARGEVVLWTDMDQSTPISELAKLLPFLQEGFDLVIGSRGNKRRESPPLRKIASFIFCKARKSILLRSIEDTQCGFKMCRTEVARRIFSIMEPMAKRGPILGWKVGAWDVEYLYIAGKQGCRIKETVVEWTHKDISDRKGRKFLRESVEMFFEVLRVRWKAFRGKYNVS